MKEGHFSSVCGSCAWMYREARFQSMQCGHPAAKAIAGTYAAVNMRTGETQPFAEAISPRYPPLQYVVIRCHAHVPKNSEESQP
jgi:hypothetical protein